MKIIKDIIRIFSANFIQLVTSLIIGFVVPVILSINDYADLKTYTFYLSYVGILQLGFHDGIYIKYGGKNEEMIDLSILKAEHNVYIIFQSIISLLLFSFALFNKDIIFLLLAISILPTNLMNFYRNYYQAVGLFKLFSKMLYANSIIYLILNIFLAIIMKYQHFELYCCTTIVANVFVCFLSEYMFHKKTRKILPNYDLKVLWNNIKVGFFVMLGSFSVIIFYALDRWFVKWFLTTNDFAYYSFAVSLLNIINTLISAVAVIFYNFLSKGVNYTLLKKIQSFLLMLGYAAASSFFILSAIIKMILPQYIPSLDITAITFIGIPLMVVINTIYINLYKASKKERRYFKIVIFMVIISFIYNLFAIYIHKSNEGIAIATVLSLITWLLYSNHDYKYLKLQIKEIVYIFILTISFISISHCLVWWVALIVYLILVFILSFIIYFDLIKECLNVVTRKIYKIWR